MVWTEDLAVAAGWVGGGVERLELESDTSSMAVLPLWIAVHQHHGGTATCAAIRQSVQDESIKRFL